MSFKRIGFIRKNLKEAILPSLLSKEKRAKVYTQRKQFKKSSSDIAAKRSVINKDFHALSPMEKEKIRKNLGFTDEARIEKKSNYKLQIGGRPDPDTLYGVFRESRVKPVGQTFIYDIENDHIEAAAVGMTHGNIIYDDPDRYPRMCRSSLVAYNDPFVLGRWMNVQDEEAAHYYEIKTGLYLALWKYEDTNMIDKIISKLDIKPEYVVIPKKVNHQKEF